MAHEITSQHEIIAALGVDPSLDPETETARRIEFLAAYLRDADRTGYVLGISGGLDSTVAGALAQRACSHVGARFTAVRLPHRIQADETDAQAAVRFIDPDQVVTIDIGASVEALDTELQSQLAPADASAADFNKGNVKARTRMTAQYAVAGHLGALVVGTDQAAEAVMGFFTKFGDGACDVAPLAGLTKGQVRQIGAVLGAPDHLIRKVPTADLEELRPALPDEVAYGVTYEQIDAYLLGEQIDVRAAATIEEAYLRTGHKRSLPVVPPRWTAGR